MSFLWPHLLWLLLILPALVLAYVLAQRKRRKYAVRYANLAIVKDALGRRPGMRRHIPPALFLAGLGVIILALARPATTVTLPSKRSTVILTMDVSGSMRADDIRPNRMEAAKVAARAFIEKQPRDVRIGVVVFSGTSALVQAPTTDRDQVTSAIDRLRTQRGTAVGSGILSSIDAVLEASGAQPMDWPGSGQGFGRGRPQPLPEMPEVLPGAYDHAVVVLLSDGQSNQGPDPLEAADRAASMGLRIYTVGLGSPQGAVIGVEGRSIRVSLDEDTLKHIARTTDGAYFKADTDTDLRGIYEALSSRLVLERQKTEITAFFAAAAGALFLVGALLSMLWFGRVP